MELRFTLPSLRKLDLLGTEVILAAVAADEQPPHGLAGLLDWRRTESAQTSWRNTSATGAANQSWRNSVGFGARAAVREIPSLSAGDRVLHTTFGMGTVVATSGAGDQAKADVDFGSVGVKRLALRHAPLEKM